MVVGVAVTVPIVLIVAALVSGVVAFALWRRNSSTPPRALRRPTLEAASGGSTPLYDLPGGGGAAMHQMTNDLYHPQASNYQASW
jgi:hypothetical protein